MKTIVCSIIFFALLEGSAAAQSNELSIAGGAQVSFTSNSTKGVGAAIQGSFAHRLIHVPFVSLYAELPVTAGFKIDSRLPQQIEKRNCNALFITPGLKLKLAPISPISPYFVAGAGWARYQQKATATTPASTNTTNAFDYGVGLDFKTAPFLGFKTEVRDYYTGPLRFNTGLATLTNSDRQHNVVAVVGLAFRF